MNRGATARSAAKNCLTGKNSSGRIRDTDYGGVGAPVGLTVFKTAGGSLGAVPGGFDSHTPLPRSVIHAAFLQSSRNQKPHES